MRDYISIQRFLEQHFVDRFALHKATQDIYVDGKPLNIIELRGGIQKEHGILLENDKYIYEIAYLLAKKKPFSPIEDYLKDCFSKHGDVDYQQVFKDISEKALHIAPDSLEAKYLSKTLVGAVSRIINPGGKFDTVLTIQGKQGIRKTSFFQALVGDDWFTSMSLQNYDKDELMTCHSKWMIELGECEDTIKPYSMSKLKSFITKQQDTYRKPYGDRVMTVPRQFILVATTNQDQFLVDSTGNRRFWCIKVDEKIDVDWVTKHRDLIWASAVKAHRDNYPVYLTEIEQQLSDALNKKYHPADMWEEIVENWVKEQKEPFTLSDVLVSAIRKEPKSWRRSDNMRVTNILLELGLEKPQRASRFNGKAGKYWLPVTN